MSGMSKALSIQHPWAGLIVLGKKTLELRSWPTAYRGRLYIHASQEYDQSYSGQWVPATVGARGAIIGAVNIVDCFQISKRAIFDELAPQHLCQLSPNYKWKKLFGWALGDPVYLYRAVPCKGALSLWTVPPEIEALVQAQPQMHGGKAA